MPSNFVKGTRIPRPEAALGCDQMGHVWLEEDGTPFHRKRDLSNKEVRPVHCQNCEETRKMIGWGDKRRIP